MRLLFLFRGDDLHDFRIEEVRRRGAGAHQRGEFVVAVADVAWILGGRRLGVPIGRTRIVSQDPWTSSVHPLGDHRQAGDEFVAAKRAFPDDRIDFLLQGAGIELRL